MIDQLVQDYAMVHLRGPSYPKDRFSVKSKIKTLDKS